MLVLKFGGDKHIYSSHCALLNRILDRFAYKLFVFVARRCVDVPIACLDNSRFDLLSVKNLSCAESDHWHMLAVRH